MMRGHRVTRSEFVAFCLEAPRIEVAIKMAVTTPTVPARRAPLITVPEVCAFHIFELMSFLLLLFSGFGVCPPRAASWGQI
jgi:hypothetical protein